MDMNRKHHNRCHDDMESKCKGCVCDTLRSVQTGTELDVFLIGGQILEDVRFVNFNQKTCCAFFNDPTTEPGSTLVVDCEKVSAIRFEAD
ncbi:hydrolase [Bacillus sp. JJ722]|uniref:hydrolase n=1 Tax=Bacillus sp. JJ722 TaxID=3122973 RepID=UPI003F68A1EE